MVLFGFGLGMFLFFRPHNIAASIQAKQLIETVYEGISGFSLSNEDSVKMRTVGPASVYGEILYDSLEVLLDTLRVGSTDVFYDLGSGVGKAVMQVALNTDAKKVVGLELSANRMDRAFEAKERLIALGYTKAAEKLELKEQDFLEASIDDATIIFLCSTCFPDDMMEKLTEKITGLDKPVKIITLRRINDPQVQLIHEYKLPMSWSEGSPVYIYKTVKGLNT